MIPSNDHLRGEPTAAEPPASDLERLERIESACAELWSSEPPVAAPERAALYAEVADIERYVDVLRVRADADALDGADRTHLATSEARLAALHRRWSTAA